MPMWAKRLKQVLIVSPERQAMRAALQDDRCRNKERHGRRSRGAHQAGTAPDFVFLTKDQLGKRYPCVSLAGLPDRGGAGLVIAADLAATESRWGQPA